jgi:hypothetical protein
MANACLWIRSLTEIGKDSFKVMAAFFIEGRMERGTTHRSSRLVMVAAHLKLNVGCDVPENHMPVVRQFYVLEDRA